MSSHEDEGTCDRCGKAVHLQHDPPCPHGICVCDTCERADVCPDCKREDERDANFARCMAQTSWTPHDLDDPLTPEQAHAEQAAWLAARAVEAEQVRATLRESRRKQAEWLEQRKHA
jgi:hypothetical protein